MSHAILPPAIKNDVGSLVEHLEDTGWRVVSSVYHEEHFGNWTLDMEREGKTVEFVKDRGQLIVFKRPNAELQLHGLWRGFEDYREFEETVLHWARATSPSD